MIVLNTEERYQYELTKAKEFGITIKNYKPFKGHDSYDGYNVDLYHKNKKFASAFDDGRGGCADIRPCDYDGDTLKIYHHVESMFRTCPEHVYSLPSIGGKSKGRHIKTTIDLEDVVQALIRQKNKVKDDREGICYNEDGKSYVIKWQYTIPTLIKKFGDKAVDMIQKRYDIVSEDHKVTNTEYLTSVGIKTINLL